MPQADVYMTAKTQFCKRKKPQSCTLSGIAVINASSVFSVQIKMHSASRLNFGKKTHLVQIIGRPSEKLFVMGKNYLGNRL